MYLTVGGIGIQIYDADGNHYKTHSLRDLATWEAYGEIEDAPPGLHNHIRLEKKYESSKKYIEYMTNKKGDADKVFQLCTKRAKVLAKEMHKQGVDESGLHTIAVMEGLLMKQKVQKEGKGESAGDGGGTWNGRYFVLSGGNGAVPKLMYYESREEYMRQKDELVAAGQGWLKPKGSLELTGATTEFPEPSVNLEVFVVKTPMKTLQLRGSEQEALAWMRAVDNICGDSAQGYATMGRAAYRALKTGLEIDDSGPVSLQAWLEKHGHGHVVDAVAESLTSAGYAEDEWVSCLDSFDEPDLKVFLSSVITHGAPSQRAGGSNWDSVRDSVVAPVESEISNVVEMAKLPPLQPGQRYWKVEKRKKGGRAQKGMFLTVGDLGVQVFLSSGQPYKTYKFLNLSAWGAEGSDDPALKNRVHLSKRGNEKKKDAGGEVDFNTIPGEAQPICDAIMAHATVLSEEMQRVGALDTAPRALGYLMKGASEYRGKKASKAEATVNKTAQTAAVKSEWRKLFFVLLDRRELDGAAYPKLIYFDDKETYDAQQHEMESRGIVGSFTPRGEMDLRGSITLIGTEKAQTGWGTIAVRSPLRTMHLKGPQSELRQWMASIDRLNGIPEEDITRLEGQSWAEFCAQKKTTASVDFGVVSVAQSRTKMGTLSSLRMSMSTDSGPIAAAVEPTGLPELPSGQRYYSCVKVLRGGRVQKGMALTVGTAGIAVFAENKLYKSYSLRDLLGWSSEGATPGVEPHMHHRLKLKKRSNGNTVEFALARGEAYAVVQLLAERSEEIAGEAIRRGEGSMTPQIQGYMFKRSSSYRKGDMGTAAAVGDTFGIASPKAWSRRYCVLFAGGGGQQCGKLVYFASQEDFETQLSQQLSAGTTFRPKGEMELAGAKAEASDEACEDGWGVFVVAGALRTLYLKVEGDKLASWIGALNAAAVSKARASASAANLMATLEDYEEQGDGGELSYEAGTRILASWLHEHATDRGLFSVLHPEEYAAAMAVSLTEAGYEIDEWIEELQSFALEDLNVFLESLAAHYTKDGELLINAEKKKMTRNDMLSLFTNTGVTAVHVGGLDGQLEDEGRLKGLFGEFGTVLAVTLRVRREVKHGKQVVSWALVSFRTVEEADGALDAAADLSRRYPGVVLKKLDESQVIQSTGSMGEVMRKHVQARLEKRLMERSVADIEMLASVPWLSPALEMEGGADFLAALADELIERDVPVGTLVIQQGDVGDEMYFVVAGCAEVRVSLSKPAVATLPVGSAFGESALLNDEPRNAFVLAASSDGGDEVSLLVLNKEGLARAMSRFPSVEAVMEEDSWLFRVQAQHDFYTDALEHV